MTQLHLVVFYNVYVVTYLNDIHDVGLFFILLYDQFCLRFSELFHEFFVLNIIFRLVGEVFTCIFYLGLSVFFGTSIFDCGLVLFHDDLRHICSKLIFFLLYLMWRLRWTQIRWGFIVVFSNLIFINAYKRKVRPLLIVFVSYILILLLWLRLNWR